MKLYDSCWFLCCAVVPRAPTRPEYVSATATHITIKWRYESSGSDDDELFPVQSYRLQQQCDGDIGWFTANNELEPGLAKFTVAASTTRQPSSSCIFRVSAKNANGIGPFSTPSLPLRTLATVPGTPTNATVRSQPLRLTWDPPLADGGSDVTGYDVQYRALPSSTWIQAPASRVNVTSRTFEFDVQAMLSYTRYTVRVRARNTVGASAYTKAADLLSESRAADTASTTVALKRRHTSILKGATREQAANTIDRYYVRGIGGGGIGRMNGEPGLVVLFPINRLGERQPKLVFVISTHQQTYHVPLNHDGDAMAQVVAVDVYGWGGGGGSGGKAAESAALVADQISKGGGGAFARGVFRVSPLDVIDIFVGGGGHGPSSQEPGRGGFHGGGDAGGGDFSGGGGGGASEVRVNGKTVLVAAGGGGGGATDYCCAHGGGGGADSGSAESGMAPNASTIPLGLIEFQHTMRDEYHFENIRGDVLEFTDARAHHTNLDFGFAGSSADYSVLATGGTGASATQPGRAGQASSYRYSLAGKYILNSRASVMEIAAPFAAFAATSGRRISGGKGQDGKEGGGGGGAGYFGGGGGGSGVDAGGGGGGISFVSNSELADLDEDTTARFTSAWNKRGERVDAFRAVAIRATAVQLSWSPPRFGYSHEVMGFTLEMANRSQNEDFRIVRIERAVDGAATTVVRQLEASKWYRFRVKVMFRDAAGKYSAIQTVQTPAHSTNTWRRVTGGVRGFVAEAMHAGLHSTDPTPLRRLPSPRRGHSLVYFDGYLYLFGGYARGYLCNRSHKSACVLHAGVNSELWRFELESKLWMELTGKSTTAVLPPAREKHSTVVVENRLLVFGGRSGDTDDSTASLNDLWELSVTSNTLKTSASLRDLETRLPLKDGKQVFTIGKVGSTPDMCVSSLKVQVRLTHSCAQTLHIQLFGPGPSTSPARQHTDTFPTNSREADTEWSDATGVSTGRQRATSPEASTRSLPVTLQHPSMFPANRLCVSGTREMTFESGMKQFDGNTNGNTIPLEPLSVFHKFSASGSWTLGIFDTMIDGNEGILESWDISFVLAPCQTKFVWRNLNAAAGVIGSPPSARYQHAAIVHRSSMFVYGGRSGADGRELNDVYRLDYSPVTGTVAQWTQLVSLSASATMVGEQRFYSGRITLLTPFELIAVGKGLRSPRRASELARHFTSGIYVGQKGVSDERRGWQRLVVLSVDEDAAAPAPRYWGACAFVPGTSGSSGAPRLYLFGGNDDTALMDDFWQLDMELLADEHDVEEIRARRQEICDWRLASSAYQQKWSSSCGATAAAVGSNHATECDVQTLLLYAWCGQVYQSMTL